MRNKILILIFFISFTPVVAQFGENHALYVSGEFQLGNYLGFDFAANYIYKEKYSFKIGGSAFIRKPKSQPYDYNAGYRNLLFVLWEPYDQMVNYYGGFGKILKLNKRGTIRANLSVGIGYALIKEPKNWQRTNNTFLEENYTWDYAKYSTLSLIINPKIEFPVSRIYGFSLSPMLQINKDRVYFGIGIGHMIGLLRKKN